MERGSRERSEGEAEESTATNRRGIEIIGEHKEQTKQLGEQNREQNSCKFITKRREMMSVKVLQCFIHYASNVENSTYFLLY